MKRLLYLVMAALMVLAVSCDKNNGKGGGEDSPALPDVVSDIRIGETAIPVQALTTHHAANFAMLDGTEDKVIYAEDIDDIKIIGTSSSWEIFPLCVPLGDKSLQEVYDLVDDKAGYALLVITDKKLNAGDYTFIDQIPVGILPESAGETIKGALEKYEEADCFEVKFETRKDLLSPAKPIVGKQWLGVDEVLGETWLYDIGYIADNVLLWWGPNQEMSSGFRVYTEGENITSVTFLVPELPHRLVKWWYDDYYDNHIFNTHEFQSSESGLEIASIQNNGRKLIFKSKWSLGDCVMIRSYYEENGEDNGSDRLMIPVNPPIKGTHRIYDLMLTVGETDYPMTCHWQSDYQDDFLAMGQNVPFVYLDAVGNSEDFQGKDVSGKVVGLNRGDITFLEKQMNAKDAGAIGVICVNNQDALLPRPQADMSSIPFGMVDLGLKTILQDCTSVSFTEAHD